MGQISDSSQDQAEAPKAEEAGNVIVCPVCGAATVEEKCKIICKSDSCRGRIIYNCAEF